MARKPPLTVAATRFVVDDAGPADGGGDQNKTKRELRDGITPAHGKSENATFCRFASVLTTV